MAAVTGSLVCRLCGSHLEVKFKRGNDGDDGRVMLLVADTTPLVEHMETCEVVPDQLVPTVEKSVPDPELAGRIGQMLETGAYVDTRGSRACSMCGVTGDECLDRARRTQEVCCSVCESGNTHPAPQETYGCAEWATEHGAKN